MVQAGQDRCPNPDCRKIWFEEPLMAASEKLTNTKTSATLTKMRMYIEHAYRDFQMGKITDGNSKLEKAIMELDSPLVE
jgi:hypothetical protein